MMSGGIVGVKTGKMRVKRAQEANKILKAYNLEQEMNQNMLGPPISINEPSEHSTGRRKYQAASIKRKDNEENKR